MRSDASIKICKAVAGRLNQLAKDAQEDGNPIPFHDYLSCLGWMCEHYEQEGYTDYRITATPEGELRLYVSREGEKTWKLIDVRTRL